MSYEHPKVEDLPAGRYLLELSRREREGEISHRGKQKKMQMRRPPEAELEQDEQPQKPKSGNGRHIKRNAASLPVATDEEAAEGLLPSLPRFCRLESCKLPLPPEARTNAEYCPGDKCSKKAQNLRQRAKEKAGK